MIHSKQIKFNTAKTILQRYWTKSIQKRDTEKNGMRECEKQVYQTTERSGATKKTKKASLIINSPNEWHCTRTRDSV